MKPQILRDPVGQLVSTARLTCCARHRVLTVPGAASPRESNIVGNIVDGGGSVWGSVSCNNNTEISLFLQQRLHAGVILILLKWAKTFAMPHSLLSTSLGGRPPICSAACASQPPANSRARRITMVALVMFWMCAHTRAVSFPQSTAMQAMRGRVACGPPSHATQ